MKTQPHRRAQGFTLIELLIVIAIISILAALLFPVIHQALIKGQAMAVGSDGRQVWLGLYTTNTEREQNGMKDLWPESGDFASSTDFLRSCIASNWLGDKFTFKYMGAPGLPVANTDDPAGFATDNNAWCVVVDAGDHTKDETPFLFTRNLISTGGGSTLDAIDAFDETEDPFGRSAGVVITFGGAVRLLTALDAEGDLQKRFNPMGATLAFMRP